ncbi:PE-PGRS family protein [Streptomyces sp. HSW2009]|uniref:PE-PGRS family protein n=1 Tax=Streptomyces sp. HSW2009 TaxID=3142890 RepID=UPI0032ED67EA
MRNVNPLDLENLAKLIDGKDGVSNKLSEAFTRASHLGVTGELATLRPLATWATETAPDLRKRAATARLEDGDPSAGLLAAGFTPDELKNYNGTIAPGTLLLANSVADSDDPHAYDFHRKDDESLADYIVRLEAHALAKIPGLQPHEESLAKFLEVSGDVITFTTVAGVLAFQGSSFVKTIGGNSFKQGWGASLSAQLASRLRRSGVRRVVRYGRRIDRSSPIIRSLSAPGSWLPGQLGSWTATRSSAYQQITRIPMSGGSLADRWSGMYDGIRSRGFMDVRVGTMSPNRAINMMVGNDELAQIYGGATHSGQPVTRAGQANLIRVYRKAKNSEHFVQSLGHSPRATSARRFGLNITKRTAGGLRIFGVGAQAGMTVYSVLNVASQNPAEKFDSREEGAGYVADVAEMTFNASLTSAMIAPTPFTIGATVATGAVYAGAKVVQHWDDIKGGATKAANWAGDKAKDIGSSTVNKAKDIGKKLNPKKWF